MKINFKEEELKVNITSLIDVIFILLIFFMVTSQFKKNALPLNLPESSDSTQQENDSSVLSVTKDKIILDSEEVHFDDLYKVLSNKKNNNPDMTLSLECEKSLEFERVVKVLTEIQKTGIDKIGIVHETLD